MTSMLAELVGANELVFIDAKKPSQNIFDCLNYRSDFKETPY